MDDPISLPLMGQFNTNVSWPGDKPVWVVKDGLAGGQHWMQHVGTTARKMTFTYHAIANDVWDFYPGISWLWLSNLTKRDDSLGRPPRVMFIHGLTIVQGYITEVGDPTVQYWESQRQVLRTAREIGPVNVTITTLPTTDYDISFSTSYEAFDSVSSYEDLARSKYGDARFGPSVREYNQGKRSGDQVELPHIRNTALTKRQPLSTFMQPSKDVTGL